MPLLMRGGGNDNDIMSGDIMPLQGDGDFRSGECIKYLEESDIVVTNPPFSLVCEFYIPQLIEYNKQFLIIGSLNWVGYKNVFPLFRNDEMWFGYNAIKEFVNSNGLLSKFGNIRWFTNLDIEKRYKKLFLWKKYNPLDYPKYDNYDAINVNKVSDIPYDYDGIMGVPISFLEKYNPNQFEIVAFRKGDDGKDLVFTRGGNWSSTVLSCPYTTSIAGMIKNAEGKINGKPTYARITIRRKLNQ